MNRAGLSGKYNVKKSVLYLFVGDPLAASAEVTGRMAVAALIGHAR
jgi:hypothetical protein